MQLGVESVSGDPEQGVHLVSWYEIRMVHPPVEL